MIGRSLGPYLIVAKLGEGGMGEVYRGRDAKLNRDVALKVLPERFANDPERLARFTREAQTLAALNHPHIAHIYGIERDALVMELVDGEDLSTCIARGPMPLAEVLAIARQIAEGLEAAHEQGFVHRDLKPANVKVRPDGTVKILDFGLARALAPTGDAAIEAANSPTFTSGPTEHGVVLGTAAYMAPEQARGRAVDKRADIWAFGAVLYEMLTGTRAFSGQGFSDVLAAVIRQEIDWTRVPAPTPPRLRQLLERCLEPELSERLRDIGEARIAIAAIERGSPGAAGPAPSHTAPPRSRERLAWTIAVVSILTALAVGARVAWSFRTSGDAVPAGVVRLSILPPPDAVFNQESANVAISPDGRMVALVIGGSISKSNQLWVRTLDSPVARRIESGDGVTLPFWSPDSRRIGFFADRKLKTVAASGGTAEIVCDAPFGRGAAWSTSNVIVFAPDANGPLYRVAASGGTPAPATTLDASRGETGHRFPAFLPDGDHVLFAAMPDTNGLYEISAVSLASGTRTRIGPMDNAPVYAEPGWLLVVRQGVLAALPFDPVRLRILGDATVLGDEPSVAPGPAAYSAGRRVSASRTGSLAYFLEPAGDTRVQWMDQTGKVIGPVQAPAGRYTAVVVAPDTTRAILVRPDSSVTSTLWLLDLARAGAVPLATVTGQGGAVWSADSTRVVFGSVKDGQLRIYEKAVANPSGEREIHRLDDPGAAVTDWSDDNAWIVVSRIDPDTKWNIYRIAAAGNANPVPVVRGPAIEVIGVLSPDGRWVAYASDETGRLDLFVQPFLDGAKTQVSNTGVSRYWWVSGGRALVFLGVDRKLWRADVDLRTATPAVSTPIELGAFPQNLISMDLTSDGRVLALVPERAGFGAVTVVQSWRAALEASR